VLGLGNIGPLAAKPVMEGKGVLFKKFAGVDVFDIEIDEPKDPHEAGRHHCLAWSRLSAASTLKTSRRPSVSYIERQLRERMNIPVFHDDQHGTAIIVGSASSSTRMSVVGKRDRPHQDRLHTGAGAAGIACLDMLVSTRRCQARANIWVADSQRRDATVAVTDHGREQATLRAQNTECAHPR
jgi:malate dehydrogenase (oxaloacetate-decarboxylating)(NADP+)